MEKLHRRFKKQVLTLILFIFFIMCISPNSVFAETIKFLDGKTVEGKVVESTDEYIRIMDTAGYVYKYPYSDIQDVSASKEASVFSDNMPESSENEYQSLDTQTNGVMTNLQDNLKKAEHMIQDTLRRLYALPSDDEAQESFQKSNTDQLKEERDSKYRKNKKYY